MRSAGTTTSMAAVRFCGSSPGRAAGRAPSASSARPNAVAIESRSPNVSAIQPIRVGDQMAPRRLTAATATPQPTPRILGIVTVEMIV